MTMSLLEISDLSVSFGAAPALSAVSLAVEAKETVAILGANGAGKSTLLRAIMGRVAAAGGSVRLMGEDLTGAPTRRLVERGVALCPEGRQLFPAMSVEDNLLLGAYLAAERDGRARLDGVYQRFSWLARRRREPAGRFSGGEQQMIAIGRALMSEPRLLLMDEPSSGLSPVAIAGVRDILRQVQRDGTAILLVEQNVRLAVEMAERCYVLNRGRIEAAGRTAEIVRDPSLADAYLGEMAAEGRGDGEETERPGRRQ
jgi:branched-chain amino acid transport system ATP-binding protein